MSTKKINLPIKEMEVYDIPKSTVDNKALKIKTNNLKNVKLANNYEKNNFSNSKSIDYFINSTKNTTLKNKMRNDKEYINKLKTFIVDNDYDKLTRSQQYATLINTNQLKDKTQINKVYDALMLLINDKKVDQTAYNFVKNYDMVNYIKNDNFVSKLKNDTNNLIKYEGISDKEIINNILSKYFSQISKAQLMNNLKYYSTLQNINLTEMAKTLRTSVSTVSDWYNGVNYPRPDKLNLIAETLKVPVESLTTDKTTNRENNTENNVNYRTRPSSNNLQYNEFVPLVTPKEDITYIDNWKDISKNFAISEKKLFAITIHGDTMAPKYLDEDIVIFQRASHCTNGKNCLVIVDNNEVYFRKWLPNEAGVVLQPLNDKEFEPMFYSNKQITDKNIKIIAVPKEIRRKAD